MKCDHAQYLVSACSCKSTIRPNWT